MSDTERQLNQILKAVRSVENAKKIGFSAAMVRAELMKTGVPISIWQVRGFLTELEARGYLKLDAAHALWRLTDEGMSAAAG